METGMREKLMELLKSFRNAMLVTQSGNKLHARPMALLKVEDNGDIWFISSIDSGKIEDIHTHPNVNVSLQDDRKYLSISGRATVDRSRAKIDELWTEECKVWFPKGKDDLSIALIHVTPSEGEYWDNQGVQGIKYVIEAVKAYVTGTTPDIAKDKEVHGSVTMNGGQARAAR